MTEGAEDVRQRLLGRFQEAAQEVSEPGFSWPALGRFPSFDAIPKPELPAPATVALGGEGLTEMMDDLQAAREERGKALRDLAAAREELAALREELGKAPRDMEEKVREAEKEMERNRAQVLQARERAEAVAREAAGRLESLQESIRSKEDENARLAARVKALEGSLADKDKAVQQRERAAGQMADELQRAFVAREKEPEYVLLKENLLRLGRQNKELLARLKEYQESKPIRTEAQHASAMLQAADEKLKSHLESLEESLLNRDRVLEDQQKTLDEKKHLIEDLFHDLKALDEQALALLEEKNRSEKDLVRQVETLTAQVNLLNVQNQSLEERLAKATGAAVPKPDDTLPLIQKPALLRNPPEGKPAP